MGGFVDSALGAVGLGGPDAPDPYATADAQSKANLDALYASAGINQMGINMPGYNISYSGDIGDPNRTMDYNLSPEMQQMADSLAGGRGDIFSSMNFMPDFSGVSGMPGTGAYAEDGQRVEDATFDAIMSRLRPEQERNTDQLLTQLNVSGNPMGSEGYGWEMDRLSDRNTDANLQASLAAVNAGRDEQSRLFGQGMTAHQQGMSDVTNQNQIPYSNLAQLMSMDPTMAQTPSQPTYQMAPPDISGLITNNYNTEAANYQSMLGGLAGLGGAAMMAPVGTFSDFRLKHNIRKIGSLPSGIPLYEFSYKGFDDRFTGVIAQEVLEVMPEAVIMTDTGFYAVDYGKLQ